MKMTPRYGGDISCMQILKCFDAIAAILKKDTMFVDVQNNRSSGRVVPPLAAGRSPTDD